MRRTSAAFNIKNGDLISDTVQQKATKDQKRRLKLQEEEDMQFFTDLYAGINNMFENALDEADM